MRKEITYRAEDGKTFPSMQECKAYENGLKTERQIVQWLGRLKRFSKPENPTILEFLSANPTEGLAAEVLEEIRDRLPDFIAAAKGRSKGGRPKGSTNKEPAKKVAKKAAKKGRKRLSGEPAPGEDPEATSGDDEPKGAPTPPPPPASSDAPPPPPPPPA